MPLIQLNPLQIFYTQQGQGQDILCLHGWAVDHTMFEPTLNAFGYAFRVSNLDLPGFGQSSMLDRPYNVDDYAEVIHQFCLELSITNPIIIAHSFGARIALVYASKYEVCKLILTGAAGLKPKRGLDYYAKVYTYKTLKHLAKHKLFKPYASKLSQRFGSDDYQQTSGVLRQSFVLIVNQDLRSLLPLIKCPTLLIWGEYDDSTPLWMGQVMAKEIPDAGLVVFEKDDHFAYWHQIDRFHRIINSFIQEDKKDAR